MLLDVEPHAVKRRRGDTAFRPAKGQIDPDLEHGGGRAAEPGHRAGRQRQGGQDRRAGSEHLRILTIGHRIEALSILVIPSIRRPCRAAAHFSRRAR